MRIGVDATCWANIRGYGRFTREICAAMVALDDQDEFVFFADRAAADVFELKAANVRLVTVAQKRSPTRAASAAGARSPFDMLKLTAAVRRERLDVFFSPSVYTYFPLPPKLRALICIHDCIAERYPELTLPSRRARWFWNAKVWLALKQARLVLTVSEYSARDLEHVLRVPKHKIRVSVEAPAPSFQPSGSRADIERVATKLGIDPRARWFVYVGGFNPHKHVDKIVRAHAALNRDGAPPTHLALVGSIDKDVFHGDQARIRELIREHGTGPLVHWTGYLPDEDLRHLHSGAIALLLPSQCEGFGLPAVEAAACATPVIATTNSPLPELLAGGGLFVEPGDEPALLDAMRRLRDEPALRVPMTTTALARARALTWPHGARSALDALRECAR
jgi:alpha-1,3-rhamnosyl/mannosyltransferase